MRASLPLADDCYGRGPKIQLPGNRCQRAAYESQLQFDPLVLLELMRVHARVLGLDQLMSLTIRTNVEAGN